MCDLKGNIFQTMKGPSSGNKCELFLFVLVTASLSNLFRLFVILNDGGIMFSLMQNCSIEIEAVVLVSFL